MAKQRSEPTTTGEQQGIEVLQTRYQALRDKKITAEANLQTAKELLENLKREAREKYATDDLEELQRKLREMQAENETKRAAYQAELDRIENALTKVEDKFSASEAEAEESTEKL